MCDIGVCGCFFPGHSGQAIGGRWLSWVGGLCTSPYSPELGSGDLFLRASGQPSHRGQWHYCSTPRSLWGQMHEFLRVTVLLCIYSETVLFLSRWALFLFICCLPCGYIGSYTVRAGFLCWQSGLGRGSLPSFHTCDLKFFMTGNQLLVILFFPYIN